MKTPIRSLRSGFTLLEIMLVVMIIALLASAAIYMMGDNLGVAQEVKAKGDIQALSTQLSVYRMNGFYPTTEQGLNALVTRPAIDPVPQNWHQGMKQLPLDPWSTPYVYQQPGAHNPDSFDVYSLGPDRKDNTGDEIGNWPKPSVK